MDVELPDGQEPSAQKGKVPRALRVSRLDPVSVLLGQVSEFSSVKGHGHVVTREGQTYWLHRSEVQDGILPVPGMTMVFLAGTRQNKSRACHARTCRKQ